LPSTSLPKPDIATGNDVGNTRSLAAKEGSVVPKLRAATQISVAKDNRTIRIVCFQIEELFIEEMLRIEVRSILSIISVLLLLIYRESIEWRIDL
jgi:hypothetical protein